MRFLILLPVLTAIVAGTFIPEQSTVSESLGQVTEPIQLQKPPQPACRKRGEKCKRNGDMCCIPRLCRYGYCV
ncbi:hypothetical protein BZA77DRAFT_44492 [Pyronema omphalodes]|nr:hypothetical protein BZA77DRAFT_44492 [Pyronema omphalodes]